MNVSRLPDRTPAGVGNIGTPMPKHLPRPPESTVSVAISRCRGVAWHWGANQRPLRHLPGHGVLDRGFDEDAARDLIEECPDC